MTTVAARPSLLDAWPVIAKIGTPKFGKRRQQADDFLGLAALREDQHHVVAMNAAQVAMNGLGGMQKMAGRAGRSQRGHDLVADQSRLAHPA